MAHALVDQLRFTRSEWLRGLQNISDEDGGPAFRTDELHQLDGGAFGVARTPLLSRAGAGQNAVPRIEPDVRLRRTDEHTFHE